MKTLVELLLWSEKLHHDQFLQELQQKHLIDKNPGGDIDMGMFRMDMNGGQTFSTCRHGNPQEKEN